ncbi:hypothetical protein ASD99_08455 [Mesorhizobium sp. Root695]|uniref:hypothetical protein n=1 Tax=Mesorhizobium sp. Root695 TaxID=1736589 RepID=UPI00070C23AB|nr:hypothetical protein [Mesorhizobium sp. Root695]KRB16388.1 hypothetical protein ASD99_08455 [Mesorhizobium sp. Root695]
MADTITQKLELARLRERKARARTARLRRSLDQTNRRTRNQVKYTLGAAIVALAESGKGEQMVAGLRRWLDHYLSRPEDRAILRHTPFSLETQEADHGRQ